MFFLWIIMGTLSRLFIHIPNVTPITSLCLLAPLVFSKREPFFIIAIILLLSDLLLHFLFHYAVLGSWTLFTYSGWLVTILAGFLLQKKFTFTRVMGFTFISALLFWVWTNLGTWLCSGMYTHTTSGLLQCYVAGLPFLRNGMIGSLVWTSICFTLSTTRNFLYNLSPLASTRS